MAIFVGVDVDDDQEFLDVIISTSVPTTGSVNGKKIVLPQLKNTRDFGSRNFAREQISRTQPYLKIHINIRKHILKSHHRFATYISSNFDSSTFWYYNSFNKVRIQIHLGGFLFDFCNNY